MATVYNIRGANGSGKTTLARAFLPPNMNGDRLGGPVDLCQYAAPTKKEPKRYLRVDGYVRPDPELGVIGVVGPYKTATGGLDNVPSFAIQQEAISYMIQQCRAKHVIAEGVLASTVYGSWAVYDRALAEHGHRFAYCYLDTPLEECLARIRMRQEASGKVREIKEDLVADKVKSIAATRLKALRDGRVVYDLPMDGAHGALLSIMLGQGEHYRAHA